MHKNTTLQAQSMFKEGNPDKIRQSNRGKSNQQFFKRQRVSEGFNIPVALPSNLRIREAKETKLK